MRFWRTAGFSPVGVLCALAETPPARSLEFSSAGIALVDANRKIGRIFEIGGPEVSIRAGCLLVSGPKNT